MSRTKQTITKLKEVRGFRTKIKVTKTRFMQKVVSTRKEIVDPFNTRFRTFISMFIPKLTPKYPVPHVMLHISNGGGSCYFRVKEPLVLADKLEELATQLRSDKWIEAFWRLQDISENIIKDHNFILDEEVLDVNEWKEDVINNWGETADYD